MRDDFGIFILTHGRPDSVSWTIQALRKARYTGRWWLVLDDEDTTRDEYAAKWGEDRILTFNKDREAETFDLADNGGSKSVIVYARNASGRLAAELGLSYYMQLDDDYTYFAHRIERDGKLTYAFTYRMDDVLEALIEFLDASGALTVAWAQGGDYVGGLGGAWTQRLKRKAMNTFIARTDRPVRFTGRINEDVNTYVLEGTRGELFLTTTDLFFNQSVTQSLEGGMTAAYLDSGTYRKSFYTVMLAPSCTKISTIGDLSQRIHHHISWNNAVPKVVPGRFSRSGRQNTNGLPKLSS